MKISDDYVKVATKQCPICLEIHSHNAEVLIHKNLRDIPDDKTFTGEGLCKEHQDKFDEGFIGLIGVGNQGENGYLKQEDAERTGDYILMKKEVFNEMFDTHVDPSLPMVFVEAELITSIKEWAGENNDK